MACSSIQSMYPDFLDALAPQIIFYFIYGVIVLLGLVGNALVIVGMTYQKVNLSVRMIFVLSLAIADILLVTVTIPLTAFTTFHRVWVFGPYMCRTIGFVTGLGVFTCSFTLLTIAIDRYFLIVRPLKPQISQPCAKAILVIVWILGFGFSSPIIFNSKLEPDYSMWMDINGTNSTNVTKICGPFCDEKWENPELKIVFGVSVFVVQYCIPLLVTVFCYIMIVRQVAGQVRRRMETENMLPKDEVRLHKRQRKTTKMTIVMVSSFMICWMPINVLNLFRDFDCLNDVSEKWYAILFVSAHCIAMSSVIVNPIIYYGYNSPFRLMINQVAHFRCVPANNN